VLFLQRPVYVCFHFRKPTVVRLNDIDLAVKSTMEITISIQVNSRVLIVFISFSILIVVLFYLKDIIIHPEYNPKFKYHDIALLRLSKSVPFSTNLRPACLSKTPVDSRTVTVIGFGRTESILITDSICVTDLIVYFPSRNAINGLIEDRTSY
jgi:hypothetical protein